MLAGIPVTLTSAAVPPNAAATFFEDWTATPATNAFVTRQIPTSGNTSVAIAQAASTTETITFGTPVTNPIILTDFGDATVTYNFGSLSTTLLSSNVASFSNNVLSFPGATDSDVDGAAVQINGTFSSLSFISTDSNGRTDTQRFTIATPVVSTTTTLSPQTDTITTNQTTQFTAVVTANSGTGTPTGNVVFDINNQAQPPVALQNVNGQAEAILPLSGLAVGQYSITATYQGGGSFAASPVSNTATLNVTALIPTTTTLSPPSVTITTNQSAQVTATVTSTRGTGTPAGNVVFTLDHTPLPPVPLQVVNGVDAAVLPLSELSAGQHTLVATYQGNSTFAMSPPSNTATIYVTAATTAPTIVAVQRFGFHAQPTELVLGFSAPLDPTTAQNVQAYRIVDPHRHTIAVDRAIYNPDNQTVTLFPHRQLNLHLRYLLVVAGAGPNAVTGAEGVPLDGANNGQPGSNFVTFVTINNWVRSATVLLGSVRRH
jgi:hypothetical protein